MEFDKKQLLELIQESPCFKSIELSEIPDIDLYMDQVTTFMENKLQEFKRTDEDKILTKTMINNYTKNQILPAPTKKKYSNKHIMLLILTYHLKQILSISDIHSLLSPISKKSDSKLNITIPIETIYENFTEIQSKEYSAFAENMTKKMSELQEQVDSQEKNSDVLILFSMIFSLIIQASLEKKFAEKLIDNFFK
jgi:hypothetical protein